jgi:hypothetical protein
LTLHACVSVCTKQKVALFKLYRSVVAGVDHSCNVLQGRIGGGCSSLTSVFVSLYPYTVCCLIPFGCDEVVRSPFDCAGEWMDISSSALGTSNSGCRHKKVVPLFH